MSPPAPASARTFAPPMNLDAVDRRLINRLQDGLPLVERPFAAIAQELELQEDAVIDRIRQLRSEGVLSRFGPLFDAEKLGGSLTLAALAVPEDQFEPVAAEVNRLPEVAHNYQRDHAYNMWFVVAAETPQALERTLSVIAERTGLPVLNLPKQREYRLHLRFEA